MTWIWWWTKDIDLVPYLWNQGHPCHSRWNPQQISHLYAVPCWPKSVPTWWKTQIQCYYYPLRSLHDHELTKKLLQLVLKRKPKDVFKVCCTHIMLDASINIMKIGTLKTVNIVQHQGKNCSGHNTTNAKKSASSQMQSVCSNCTHEHTPDHDSCPAHKAAYKGTVMHQTLAHFLWIIWQHQNHSTSPKRESRG